MIPQPLLKAALLAAAVLFAPAFVPALVPAALAAPMMGPPLKLDSKAQAQVVNQLVARRPAVGLDADHGYKVMAQHPGVQGTHVVRAAHLYKGLRIFGSESVVVLDARRQIVSESASPRRLHLGRGAANRMQGATGGFNIKPTINLSLIHI